MQQHMWGVATDSRSGNRMEHIEFTVWYDDGEQHIPRRLEREKRIGKVEYIDEHTCRFLADVYDASELIPWIRTFICRITDISISNKFLEIQFKKICRRCMRCMEWKGEMIMLFHEIYSTYFQTVGKILTEAVEHPLTIWRNQFNHSESCI